MDMMNRLLKLRPNLDKGDVSIQDNSDGNGPFIVEWNSAEIQPTKVELDSVDDSPSAVIVAQAEIIKLESQITNRRLREAYKDSTWLDAQEALIKTQRDKL